MAAARGSCISTRRSTAFLAVPNGDPESIVSGITYQSIEGTNYLAFIDSNPDAFADSGSDTFTLRTELPLFSNQVTPAELRNAYGINQIAFIGAGGAGVTADGAGQTIAIVEEGIDPTIGPDLDTFDQFFGIPAPPSFRVFTQSGARPDVSTVGEASLDVEWAHAIAPGASIVVYDAASSFASVIEAMQQASKLPGVSVVTLSYAGAETSLDQSFEQSFDSDFTTPGVTFLAASGDSGIFGNGGDLVSANYPAASPNVVAVGGTSIVIDSAGDYPGTGSGGEAAWGDGVQSGTAGGGGGGLSAFEPEPSWQRGVVPSSIDPASINARALPDVSMDSGSAQEYDVFTSTLSEATSSSNTPSGSAVGWLGDAGTSAAAPIWAGLIAIADQGRALESIAPLTGYSQTLPALYSLPSADFHDIVSGNNGDPAGPGYDLATGLGTPVANRLVPDLVSYGIPTRMAIQTEPPASVAAGSIFGLTIAFADGRGNPASGGIASVSLGNNPGGAILSGTLSAPIENGVASFSNLTLNQLGAGYTLTVTDTALAGSLTTTAITVTPAPITVLSEQAVFVRKLNKKGKPVGSAMLSGFKLDFNLPPAAAANRADYALDVVKIVKVKKGTKRVLQPIKNFTVSYTPGSDSVTLELSGKQTFPSGGQLTVMPGVTGASGSVLMGTRAFTITAGGKKIKPL